jgi:L-lactate dehydrogenase complex protein LldF
VFGDAEHIYPGPIGALLTPQLKGLGEAPTLPWASSLWGACYEVCPVKLDIPSVLVHLRARVVAEEQSRWEPERLAMDAVGAVFGLAQALRGGAAALAPGPRAAGEAVRAGLDRDARAARGAGAAVPGVVT